MFDRRGISYAVKLIVLFFVVIVAVTAIVAVYLSEQHYVDGLVIVAGDFNGVVYDNDNTLTENYQNENVLITFYMTYGYLRNVGDPSDGLVVTVGSQQNSWGPFLADARGQVDYGNGYVTENGEWTGGGLPTNARIRWELHVPVTSAGHLEKGENAYLYLWAESVTGGKLQPSIKLLWDNGDNLMISVASSGDAFTAPYGTVRLLGFPLTA
jgi:hypothetical protein